jgi:hypothetical protein
MRKHITQITKIALIISIILLTACQAMEEQKTDTQSAFKGSFSLASLVEKNQGLLLPGSSWTASGTESGHFEPFTQSQEESVLQVDSAHTQALWEALQAGIQDEITRQGGEIVGSGESHSDQANEPSHFSYSYQEGQFFGVINLWGVRGEGDTFVVITQITESPPK